MFRALFAHLQEALHKQQLVYRLRNMWLAATRVEVPNLVAASRHNTHALYQFLFMQRLLKMSK
jgi:hypothetical protein